MLVARIEPAVGAEHGEIVHMQIIGRIGVADEPQFIRRKAELFEMLGGYPFPHDFITLGNLMDHVVPHLRL